MHQSYEKALEFRNTELEETVKDLRKQLETISALCSVQGDKLLKQNKIIKDYLAIIDMYSTRVSESMTIDEAQDWAIKMLQHTLRVDFE